ncbi:trypsin-1-like [Belonocnema kinseyi]|uniref:trypsin-1-like n=1 Tax=Belonocnema kinseyi TaxID=2817044 RepID=UPI00143D0C76|nr:trypsin-1-like [Belonocnema kinseyi]
MHITLAFFALLVALVSTVSSNQEKENLTENALNYTTGLNPIDDKLFFGWWQQLFGPKPAMTTVIPDEPAHTHACSSCECGITNKRHRIVGGVETQVNQYPWVALLMHKGRFYCGGTVINSKFVLTASHCVVDRFDKNAIVVRILEHDRNTTSESDIQNFKVSEILRHGSYSTVNYDNDIALLKIEGEFNFKDGMRPVCLPEKAKTFSGMTGIVTGWGAVQQSGPLSTVLQEVMVPIMSNEECRMTRYPARRITDNMLCAGYREGAKDSCQGDSGGPLHVANETVHSIVGVVSWGEGCAQPNFPGVYTRVNRFLTWIERNTADACYCDAVLRKKISK